MAVAASISRALTRKLRLVEGISSGSNNSVSLPRPWDLPPLPPCYSPFSTSAVPESLPASSSQAPGRNERRSGWSKLFLFLPGALTFGLGTWQIFRRQDKIKMLEYRQKRLEMEPLMFNGISPSDGKLDPLEFRRVKCKGFFDEKRSIYLGPRSRSISGVTENGYHVITPLMPIPNSTESMQLPILVNRGWVPRSWKDRSVEDFQSGKQPLATPSVQDSERSSWWRFWSPKRQKVEVNVPAVNPTEVVGVVRGSEKPSIFVPANDPSSCQWFYVDVPAIARATGLPENTVYIEDINENVNPSNPYPLPKDVNTLIRSSVMPQDHLNYTLTWYSLSAAVTFMAFKRLRTKKNHR
ncbi:surfeit locus protein 1-like isoform X1 [Carya illinoinensis]|uniref:surfeit locus protein 1-like isoform X1 n=1 Tax=Carya illinoinensis TaxID=32201 RepID=UPI001C71B03C|nr:surfeit locus protein 1-like isoform X1 [Carya illinoinensis]